MAKDDEIPLFDLLERETDPELKQVLEHYRGAEIELQCAAELLGKTKRARWEMAALSYSRDVALQAQRYMAIERARLHKLSDFRDDADTNPVGYPRMPPPPLGSKPLNPAAFDARVADSLRAKVRPLQVKPPLHITVKAAAPLPPLPARFDIPKAAPSIVVDLDDALPAEVHASDEAVLDTERPPAPNRVLSLVLNFTLTFIIVLTLWLLRREVTVP